MKFLNPSDNVLMKILCLFTLMFFVSCIESKKEADNGTSPTQTGTKYFVSKEEIQVLNKVFENQFSDVATELIVANATSVGTESLLSGGHGISFLESEGELIANCENFKTKYIDSAVNDSGIVCTTNQCSNEVHIFDGCVSSNIDITCDENFNVSSLQTGVHVDYSKYQEDDVINLSGWVYGIVNGGGFSSSELECEFSFTYTYGSTLALGCDNTTINCTIDGNVASCEQVLDVGAGGTTVSGCSL